MNERGPISEAPQDGRERWRVAYVDARVVLTTSRLTQREPLQKCEKNTWKAHDQKRRAPTPVESDKPACGASHECAEGYSKSVDGHRGRTPLSREVIGDDGDRGRRASRFADSDADPRYEQVREVTSETG